MKNNIGAAWLDTGQLHTLASNAMLYIRNISTKYPHSVMLTHFFHTDVDSVNFYPKITAPILPMLLSYRGYVGTTGLNRL